MGNLVDFNIDWNSVEEVSFDLVPAGIYALKAVKAVIKNTKKGDKAVNITFEVISSNKKFKGKKIFESYLIRHTNPDAMKIGLGKIKSFARNIGINFDTLEDTSELCDKPVGAKVKVEKSEQYGDKNKVTSFSEYEESLLENTDEAADIKVDNVEEAPIVEDEPIVEDSKDPVDNVEEVVIDEPTEEVTTEVLPTVEDINKMKQKVLVAFVKEQKLGIQMGGKKVSEIKEAVIDVLYGSNDSEESEEDIVIEE